MNLPFKSLIICCFSHENVSFGPLKRLSINSIKPAQSSFCLPSKPMMIKINGRLLINNRLNINSLPFIFCRSLVMSSAILRRAALMIQSCPISKNFHIEISLVKFLKKDFRIKLLCFRTRELCGWIFVNKSLSLFWEENLFVEKIRKLMRHFIWTRWLARGKWADFIGRQKNLSEMVRSDLLR